MCALRLGGTPDGLECVLDDEHPAHGPIFHSTSGVTHCPKEEA